MTDDIYPPAGQRQALLALMPTLGCCEGALRRDECGDWRVEGKRGHIYAIAGTGKPWFLMYVTRSSARGWTAAKKALVPFTRLVNDGDEDGLLFLDRLPSADEAEAIRGAIGVRKRRTYTDEALAELRARFQVARGFQPQKLPSEADA